MRSTRLRQAAEVLYADIAPLVGDTEATRRFNAAEDLLDKLIRNRASGLRVVEHEGRRLEYKSDNEMAAAIAESQSGSRPQVHE